VWEGEERRVGGKGEWGNSNTNAEAHNWHRLLCFPRKPA